MKFLPALATSLVVISLGLALWSGDSSANKLTLESSLLASFSEFRTRFNKTYHSLAETRYRMAVFEASLATIAAHNSRTDVTYTLGINEFSDMSWEEFASSRLPPPGRPHPLPASLSQVRPRPIDQSPPDAKRVNWYERGMVTEVKNMGACQANYAFAVTAIVEEAYALHQKSKPPVLSEQEIIDCSVIYENQGCQGGHSVFTMHYVRDYGINTAADYPYTAKDGQCRQDMQGKGPFRPKKWWSIEKGNVAMIETLFERPLTAGMVILEDFKHYKGGIYNRQDCKGERWYLVNSIGYDISTREPYFIAKNFWGESWGEKGFFRIAMAPGDGVCGFTGDFMSTYAIIDPKQPSHH